MEYSVSVEKLGEPSLKLDGEMQQDINQVSSILSALADIEFSKVSYFVEKFGLNKILNEPSIMGISAEQETIIIELKELILFGEDSNETNYNVKPVRY